MTMNTTSFKTPGKTSLAGFDYATFDFQGREIVMPTAGYYFVGTDMVCFWDDCSANRAEMAYGGHWLEGSMWSEKGLIVRDVAASLKNNSIQGKC